MAANYASTCFLGFLAGRQHSWAYARIAAPCSLFFVIGIMIVSIDGYHYFFSDRLITWVWFLVYGLVPIQMTLFWLVQIWRQARNGQQTRLRLQPLPLIIRFLLGLNGVLLLAGAYVLFNAAPYATPEWFPWDLSGRPPGRTSYSGADLNAGMPAPMELYVAVWLVSIAIFQIQTVLENDWIRIRPALLTLAAFGLLHAFILVRYAETVRWAQPATWLWVWILLTHIAISIWGIVTVRRASGLLMRL